MRFSVFSCLVGMWLMVGCSKWKLETKPSSTELTPQVETINPVGTPTSTAAQVQCQVISTGLNTLAEFGILYAITNDPTLKNGIKVIAAGTGTAPTTVQLTGLTPGTNYYYRAFATNSKGITGYGASKNFTTSTEQNPDFVYVSGGSFTMGGNNGKDDEKPTHTVAIKSFYIAKKELTVKQYRDFCNATGRALPTAPFWGWIDTHPIVNITWTDATAYCQWFSSQTRQKYRLPTEAEWEYAAKGGSPSQTYTYAGSDNIDEVAWSNRIAQGTTHPVATRPKANQLGLYDMTGNAQEWCSDWYSSTYYQSGPASDPIGPVSGTDHIFRGGSWNSGLYDSRVESRFSGSSQGINIGFRLALDQ